MENVTPVGIGAIIVGSILLIMVSRFLDSRGWRKTSTAMLAFGALIGAIVLGAALSGCGFAPANQTPPPAASPSPVPYPPKDFPAAVWEEQYPGGVWVCFAKPGRHLASSPHVNSKGVVLPRIDNTEQAGGNGGIFAGVVTDNQVILYFPPNSDLMGVTFAENSFGQRQKCEW